MDTGPTHRAPGREEASDAVNRNPSTESDLEVGRIRGYFSNAAGSWGRWSAGRTFLVEERQRLLAGAARTYVGLNIAAISVCDVGCGRGDDLAFWRDAGVPVTALAGTEIMAENVSQATAAVPGADVRRVDSFELPFEGAAFVVTTASLVLSTILEPSLRRMLFREMIRVTAPGGVVLVYDFSVRKPTNKNVVALDRRRAAALGGPPDATWRAAPFLPLLPAALRLPAPLRRMALAVLPRTHVLYAWRRVPAPDISAAP